MKDDLYLIDSDVYKAVKRQLRANEYPNELSVTDIEAVFSAYAEIVRTGVLRGIAINLPKLGKFIKQPKKGWKGRTLRVCNTPFTNADGVSSKEIPSKPNYHVIKFKIKPSIQKAFKEATLGQW